jgi:GNAT superfamily N-acetyltransferase
VPSHEDEFELIELNERAREFLLLEVKETQQNLVMCADPTEQQKDPWLWRLLVDKSHQGRGIGKFAVESVLARYREMGCSRVLVCWAPVDGNAGDFYKKIGFLETGEKMGDEIVAEFRF